jgi:hypothetical protein
MHRSIRGFSQACPRLFHEPVSQCAWSEGPDPGRPLLHGVMTYCSTDLSATSPPSYRQFINRFSTTCPPACPPVASVMARICGGEETQAHQRGPAENGSGALIPASGPRKHRAAHDGCKAKVKTPARPLCYNSSESSTAHSPRDGHEMPDDAADAGTIAAVMTGRRGG